MKKYNVPNKENVRFIHLRDFIKLFNFDKETRAKFNTFLEIIEAAHKPGAGLDILYKEFYKATEYLDWVHMNYHVGWRVLSKLPF